MSDEKGKNIVPEPPSVIIPLEDRGELSRSSSRSRKSSTSTSSFEDIDAKGTGSPRPVSRVSQHSNGSLHSSRSHRDVHESPSAGPATIDVESEDMKDSQVKNVASQLKGPSVFKTTSLGDPQFYAQTTSPSPSFKSARGNVHSANKKYGARDDRDPENVNDIVKIRFEEIFAEPEGTYSFGTIWGATYRIFTDTKLWCYKFLSALCGVPCALCWGLHFACLSFCQIWYYQPSIRSFTIQVKPCAKMFGIFITAFVEPCLIALGKLFSNIRLFVIKE